MILQAQKHFPLLLAPSLLASSTPWLKLFLVILLYFFNALSLNAQNSPYLVPRQIYVGDPATLVVPLPAAAHNAPDIILTKREYLSNESIFPTHESLEIYKITLEKRTAGSRLLIEFTAFAPGVIELPFIEIGGEIFTGLSVKVNSLLEAESANPAGKARLLSGAASVLAMPGTALMLYGSLTLIVVVILLSIWFIFKGRAVIKDLREKWKRYRLYTGMYSTEKRLTKALAKGVDKRIILDKLSFEFREFLSILTGKNCRSMTAREFNDVFLGEFFGICDKLRFSGTDIGSNNIEKLLNDLKEFLDLKKKEEKAK